MQLGLFSQGPSYKHHVGSQVAAVRDEFFPHFPEYLQAPAVQHRYSQCRRSAPGVDAGQQHRRPHHAEPLRSGHRHCWTRGSSGTTGQRREPDRQCLLDGQRHPDHEQLPHVLGAGQRFPGLAGRRQDQHAEGASAGAPITATPTANAAATAGVLEQLAGPALQRDDKDDRHVRNWGPPPPHPVCAQLVLATDANNATAPHTPSATSTP